MDIRVFKWLWFLTCCFVAGVNIAFGFSGEPGSWFNLLVGILLAACAFWRNPLK